jgi:hypothetical protein
MKGSAINRPHNLLILPFPDSSREGGIGAAVATAGSDWAVTQCKPMGAPDFEAETNVSVIEGHPRLPSVAHGCPETAGRPNRVPF